VAVYSHLCEFEKTSLDTDFNNILERWRHFAMSVFRIAYIMELVSRIVGHSGSQNSWRILVNPDLGQQANNPAALALTGLNPPITRRVRLMLQILLIFRSVSNNSSYSLHPQATSIRNLLSSILQVTKLHTKSGILCIA
jgi:hypothetical protein